MEHSEFVETWNQGKLEVDVNRSKALQIANSKMLPKRYRAAHIFWSWVWMLSIPAGIAVMFLYKWWVGMILLLVTPVISKATKKSAMQFMIDYSLESPEFYQYAIAESIIKVKQKP